MGGVRSALIAPSCATSTLKRFHPWLLKHTSLVRPFASPFLFFLAGLSLPLLVTLRLSLRRPPVAAARYARSSLYSLFFFLVFGDLVRFNTHALFLFFYFVFGDGLLPAGWSPAFSLRRNRRRWTLAGATPFSLRREKTVGLLQVSPVIFFLSLSIVI